jgi:putative transposase
MRPPQYTITPSHLHAHAAWRIPQHVRLPDPGRKCRACVLWAVLFYAASRTTSLAAACAALRDAPSDTAAHDALLAALPAFAELQRRLNRALQGGLPKALRRQRQPLAIDLTLIPYHGQPLHDPHEIYRSQAKSGTSHFHAYATAYVIRKGRRFTVALTAVGRDDPLPEVLKRLLRQAAQAGVRPRYLLLDRGFCGVAVIRYLQAARHAWLMPLVLRGRKADHPQGPSGSRVFAAWKASGWGQYTMTNAAGRTATFRVCVRCRNRRGERGRHGREARVYAFGGPLEPPSYQWVKETYRSRFAIETSYRQMHQARIRTCTRNPLLRLLYVGVALVLRNVWVWLHWEVLAQRGRGPRRIDLSRMSFRRLLLWLQHDVEQWLGIHDQTHAQRPAWGGFTSRD